MKSFSAIFLFVTGLLLILLLAIIAVWPNLEASLFDATRSYGEQMRSLRCPLLITPADEATIRLKLTNPLELPANFTARARISVGGVTQMREVERRQTVQPGDSVEFSWPIWAEEAVYGRMILARVQVLSTRTLPVRYQACGMMVLDVPWLHGNQIVGALLTGVLVCLSAGAWLWLKDERPLLGRNRQLAYIGASLALLLLLTFIMGLVGWWGIGLILMIVIITVLIAFLGRK